MEVLVSVCLPNYNYDKFLKDAIDSVLSQTYTNFELIIGDNASTDTSIEIIKSYNDPRIKFYQNESNIPLYQNINQCKNLAKGELIAVLHSDDKYDANFLEEIVKAYKKNPDKQVFVTGVNFWHFEENQIKPWHPYHSGGIKSKYEALIRLAINNNIGNGVNVVCHKNCFENDHIFNKEYKYAADYDLWLRLANKFDFVYIPKILAYYRIHDSNLSHTVNKNLDMFKEGIEIFEKNFSQSIIIPEKTKQELIYIQYSALIERAFQLGVKYKSGNISRNMLNYVKTHESKIIFEPDWHLIYFLSYLISNKFSKILNNFISFAGRLILYYHRININNSLKKLINEHTKILNSV